MLEEETKTGEGGVASAVQDGAIGVDSSAEVNGQRFFVCTVNQSGIHPGIPHDDQDTAIAGAMAASQGGATACVALESKLQSIDKGEGIVIAFRDGKVFPLRDNLIKAQQDLEEMMERRRRNAEKRREAEERKKRADQLLYGVVAGFCGVVIALILMQIFL